VKDGVSENIGERFSNCSPMFRGNISSLNKYRREYMNGNYLSFVILICLLFPGCGSSQPTTPEKATAYVAADDTVNSKLAPALKEKQTLIAAILSNIREGARPDNIAQYVPCVKYSETKKQFFDDGVRLVRWKFNGDPKGDEVNVTLTIATSDSSDESSAKTVNRTYIVTKDKKDKKGLLTVTRK
jgi:hypothetical protein